jgi:2-polyprenyl-3-methyl-5-hydroxy-6-metoxy-1,4-benzoquinol methylase
MTPLSDIPLESAHIRGLRRRIISTYESRVIRAYCTIRFLIINLRILDELEQYLPLNGLTVDLGCGFGLFSLYFAMRGPGRQLLSLDLNGKRIQMARRSAEILGVADRTEFIERNVVDHPFDHSADAIVTLDLLHHIPPAEVPRILQHCHRILKPGGILLVKEITARPRWKAFFTWVLDKAMDPKTPVHYYGQLEMKKKLMDLGFTVRIHQMVDVLPYPHIIYICTKTA